MESRIILYYVLTEYEPAYSILFIIFRFCAFMWNVNIWYLIVFISFAFIFSTNNLFYSILQNHNSLFVSTCKITKKKNKHFHPHPHPHQFSLSFVAYWNKSSLTHKHNYRHTWDIWEIKELRLDTICVCAVQRDEKAVDRNLRISR